MNKFNVILSAVAILALIVSGFALYEAGNVAGDIEAMGLHPGGTELHPDSGSTVTGDFTVGADGSGEDVTFYSDTSGDSLLWDSSDEALEITGTNGQDALDISDGNVDLADDLDVDGTTNLDAVDVDGAVQIDNTVTVGVAGTSFDVTFYSDTSGDHFLWDSSAETLIITGTNAAEALQVDDGNVAFADDLDIGGAVNFGSNDLYPLGYASSGDAIVCGTTGVFTDTTTVDLSGSFSDVDYIVAIQITDPAATGSILTVDDPGAGTNAVFSSWESDFTAGTSGVNAFYCAVGDE